MITLSLLHPLNKNPVQHWNFEEEPVIRIGRSTDNHVVLYSAVVSRHHVELRHKPSNGWEIVNLGTNGTYLDGKRITQVPVKDGIIIRLARSGPNIQINVGEDGREAVRALLRLKADAASHLLEHSNASGFVKPTEVQAVDDTVSSAFSEEADKPEDISEPEGSA